jgi:hypothetical protein
MRRFAPAIVVVACCLSSFPLLAFAQEPSTVGDLLTKGGKRLAREEMVSLIAGATMSGVQIDRSDVTFENEYKSDGTVKGFARNAAIGLLSITGTWSVDEQGRLCVDLSNNRGGIIRNCTVFFVLDGQYYSAGTEARETRVWLRSIKR